MLACAMDVLEKFTNDYKNTFIRYIKMINFIGLDFYLETGESLFKSRKRYYLFLICFIIFFLCQITFIFRSHKTDAKFLDIANAVPCLVLVIQDFVKLLAITTKRKEIKNVIFKINDEWPKEKNYGERSNIIENWTKRNKSFQNVYYGISLFCLCIYELIPLVATLYNRVMGLDTEYFFPFELYYPYKVDSFFVYLVTYFCQAFASSSLHACIYIASDLLITSLLSDVTALFALLQYDLENVTSQLKQTSINQDEEQYNCAVKNIVNRHQRLLGIIKELNGIYGVVIFIFITSSSIICCFFCFLTVVQNGLQSVKNLLAGGAMLGAILVVAFPGQQHYDMSFGVAYAAYCSLWYERNEKFKNLILILIVRSQRASCLSALGFSDVTLATFSKVSF
uniref:Odorant receptor n=1 Tax=Histia rhodope TaxID=1453155 RepID=A0A7G4KBU0_9NEOP|nr:odorant receptor [Histia rhodope]